MRWIHVAADDEYRLRDDETVLAIVADNGAGLGPAAGSGRWAVIVAGTWIENVDKLKDAKELAIHRITQMGDRELST